MVRAPILTDDDLEVTLQSFGISPSGVATATLAFADGAGRPLDIGGAFTEGTVRSRFVLAWLDEDDRSRALQYTAYTTRPATSTATGLTTLQPAPDTDGTFVELRPGLYRYRFGTRVIVGRPDRTHTLTAWFTRSTRSASSSDHLEHDFRPDGQPVAVRRQVVADATCDACHQGLRAHEAGLEDVRQCVTCHSEQALDPDSGQTVDFKVMIHKIHMGANLPSVQAGERYALIGADRTTYDYSEVHYPRLMNDCRSCHAEDALELWRTRPDRSSCVGCHDDVAFSQPVPTGKRLHSGGPWPDDGPCVICHPAQGSLAGITEMHARDLLDPALPRVDFDVLSIRDTGPGQSPTIRFRVSVDERPRDILASPLTALRATFAGPNTEFATYWQSTIQGSGATGTLVSAGGVAGVFEHTVAAAAALPANATGSYTVALEGYVQPTGSSRRAGFSRLFPFAVTDPTPRPRREIVDGDKCNACHGDLAAHGSQRKNPTYCTTCHNPNQVGDERFSRLEGMDVFFPTVDLRVMIHKIHAGIQLSQQPYILGGNPAPTPSNPVGNPIDFGRVRYPGELGACSGCHLDGTYTFPLVQARLPTRLERRICTEPPRDDADRYCQTPFWSLAETRLLPPATAVCTSCHDAPDTLAHAQLNTTIAGAEACGTCHGPGSAWDVDLVHPVR